jgi:hypothetical protein
MAGYYPLMCWHNHLLWRSHFYYIPLKLLGLEVYVCSLSVCRRYQHILSLMVFGKKMEASGHLDGSTKQILCNHLDNHLYAYSWLRILTGYKHHIGGDIGSFYCKGIIQVVASLSEKWKSFWCEKRTGLLSCCFKTLKVAVRKTRFAMCFLEMPLIAFNISTAFSVYKWEDKYNMNVVINSPVTKRIILYCLEVDWCSFL